MKSACLEVTITGPFDNPIASTFKLNHSSYQFHLNFWKYHLSTLSRNMHRKWPSLFYLKKKLRKRIKKRKEKCADRIQILNHHHNLFGIKKTSEGVKPTNIYPSKNIMHIFWNPITHETITQLKLRVFVFCFFLSVSHS